MQDSWLFELSRQVFLEPGFQMFPRAKPIVCSQLGAVIAFYQAW